MRIIPLLTLIISCAPAERAPFLNSDVKPASVHTKRVIEDLRASLPFSDERDFEEQQRGFLAAPDYQEIMADAGHVAWSMGKYEFLLEDRDFDSIHPSFAHARGQRTNSIAKLCGGIPQVVEGNSSHELVHAG